MGLPARVLRMRGLPQNGDGSLPTVTKNQEASPGEATILAIIAKNRGYELRLRIKD
jgi:hypothetical protein